MEIGWWLGEGGGGGGGVGGGFSVASDCEALARAPVYPPASDSSITMAAPQLPSPRQLQRIIIRGTMKWPGHWQLICL